MIILTKLKIAKISVPSFSVLFVMKDNSKRKQYIRGVRDFAVTCHTSVNFPA